MEAPRLLEHAETQFVTRVATHLRDLAPARRAELVEEVRSHLRDRPSCHDEDELWTQLGTPTDYSVALREVHGLAPERADWWARWMAIPRARRTVLVVGSAVATVLLVGGGLTLRWWVTWHADARAVSASIAWADRDGAADPSTTTGITWMQPQHPSARIDFVDRYDVVVEIVFLADRPPERVTVPWQTYDGARSPVAVVSATIEAHGPAADALGERPVAGSYVARLHLRAACPSTQRPGNFSSGFDSIRVHYEALGRARSTEIDLGTSFSFYVLERTC